MGDGIDVMEVSQMNPGVSDSTDVEYQLNMLTSEPVKSSVGIVTGKWKRELGKSMVEREQAQI